MDKWLKSNAVRIQQLFKTYDYEGECMLTYDEFKSGKKNNLLWKIQKSQLSGDFE